jgi:lipopolysaccharide export system protein LptA
MGKGRPAVTAMAFLLALLAVPAPGLTDNTASTGKKKTVLEHADTIEGGESTDATGKVEPFRSANGNVLIRQGTITLSCDRAIDYPESDRIILKGNIVIKDNTVESYGDQGVYHPEPETGGLSGNVRGRVLKDSLVAKAKRSTFNLMDNELWLFDDAIAWHHGRQLSGDIIRLHMKEVDGRKKVDEIRVRGHAFFAARDTLATGKPLFDQLSGDFIQVTLDDRSRLTGVTVTTKGKSLYHIYDNRNQPAGVNYTSGNLLRMYFREGKLSRIRVTGAPLGKQYPDSMRENKEIDLPGFSWREKEMPVFP